MGVFTMRNAPPVIEAIKAEHRSLAILRVLERQAGYRSNEQVLADYLERIALWESRKILRENLNVLKERGLINIDWCESLIVVTLTESGQDVALGRIIVEGVLRPGPECAY